MPVAGRAAEVTRGGQGGAGPTATESILELTGSDAAAVLDELAAGLAGRLPGSAAPALARELREREALGATALGGGVAVPHCRVRGIESPRVVVARHAAGVEFGAPDGAPVRLFVAIATPAGSPGAHLRLLARLARLLRDRARVERLLGRPEAEVDAVSELAELLAGEGTA